MDELLIEIWALLPLRDRISVSQVCHHWRTVALDAKMLWTEINIEVFSSRKVTALLERSGHSPLHISAGNKKLDKSCLSSMSPNQHESSFAPRHLTSGRSAIPPRINPKQLKPFFFHQSAFDKVVGRAERLDATVGTDKSQYVTFHTLKTPMPYLKRLLLREETRGSSWGVEPMYGPTATDQRYSKYKEMPDVFFSGVTPLLQDVSFTVIHAPWDDPIYHNLTRLRLTAPKVRAKPSTMLRLLANCPQLVQLGLNETMSPILHNRVPNPADIPIYLDPTEEMDMVHLNHLKWLAVEESDAAVFPKLFTRILAPALDKPTLIIPDTSCLVDHRGGGGPFQALRHSFSQTTALQISGNNGQLNVSGDGGKGFKSPRFIRDEGWSVCCRPRMRT